MNQTRTERTGARPARQRRRAPLGWFWLLALWGAQASAQPLQPTEVAPGVWMVQGASALGQELIAAIGRVTRQPIRQVIVTHYHADHIYGLQARRAELAPFEAAYAQADGSRFEHLPLFKAANRINAYNTYLLMERSTP